MSTFLVLLWGEMKRMARYNIIAATFIANFIWVAILHFAEVKDVSSIFPTIVMFDAISIAILVVGVTLFFEKQEGALKTLLVSPVSKLEYVLAKTWATIIISFITLTILYSYAYFFKEIDLNIWAFSGVIILVCLFHAFIGFLLSYYSRDFTELIMAMMKYFFIFSIPMILEILGVIDNELVSKALFLIPSKPAMVLLQSTLHLGPANEISFSIIYYLLSSAVLLWLVMKQFNQFAFKESGV